MSPRHQMRELKVNNETTPRKKQSNVKSSKTPLAEKFNKMSFSSPSRNVHSSPLSGSDKENYRNEENIDKKQKLNEKPKGAEKRLPFGLSNQGNVMEDDNSSIASRTRTSNSRTPPRRQTTLSSQKRVYHLSDSDPDDKNYICKSSPKKNFSIATRSSPRLKVVQMMDSNDDQKKEEVVSIKSPRKMTLRNSPSRSTTPQRKQLSIEAFQSEEQESDDDFNDQHFELDEESDDCESSAESVDSAFSKASKKKKESRKKNTVETFEEEPETSKIELLLRPITKLELEVMEEDASRKAETRRKRENNPLMKVYPLFHTSALPDVLLKRETHCAAIENFIKHAVAQNSSVHNRSIYISGVPGTGKTACVTKVIQKLQLQKKPVFKFTYVYVNGLELVKPQHVFSEIYNNIYPSSRPVASKTARDKLSKIFRFNDSKRLPILLVVDELDMLCTKSQDVVYDIFDWASTEEARFSVIAIANTLDLPERVLKQRVSSRMGYTRLTFQPYNHEEIISILDHRVKNSEILCKKAFGFISRKVAAVSGDLRKALEFIRRSIEIAVDNDEDKLTMKHGYTRLTFEPYNHAEIICILDHRIKNSETLCKKAFGFISRKVAAVSGDLRKALEFIRRSIEIAVDNDEDKLTMKHVSFSTAAVKESLQSMPILFTKSLSSHQECLLRSIVQEIRATSLEELDFFLVYDCYHRNCLHMTLEPMEMSSITGLLSSLQRIGYIDIKCHGLVSRRISLKTSVDEIDYLLRQMKLSNEC
uniref:Origin recognition complex subunit 1 n=1 Tax=Panagrolaimus sp. PS1159 TaxID=55785 RepID=A0AC35FIB7_9BILA